jgi:RecB family exonuclease
VKITGSALPMLKKCQWWARPEVVAPPQSPPSEAMLVGTAVHAAIENTLTRKPVPALEDEAGDLLREWQQWWKTSPLASEKWQAEVAYAYDTAKDAARFIGASIGRGYETSATEIPGTIDALLLEDDHAVIIDWKTGSSFGHGPADAADNQQLRLYALMVARAHKLDTIHTHIVRITDQGVRQTSATLDAMDLDAVAQEVAQLVRAIPDSPPRPGGHCTRCRAVALCPSTQSAMAVVAPPEPVELKIATPEHAAQLLIRLRQVQAACETMEAALKLYAANRNEEGIPLPSGKRWVRQSVDRESINLNGDANALGIAIISMAGAEKALEPKISVSKAGIERELKAQGLKGKELRDKVEGLMSELRAAGATRTTTVDAYREV